MESKVWWTRVSRIQAEKRLLANKEWLELLTLWYSLSAVFVSIWLLVDKSDGAQYASLTFTCFSIFVLSVSLYGSGSKYPERASQLKDNYVSLNELYLEILHSGTITKEHNASYKHLLNSCENHENHDYARALINIYLTTKDKKLVDRVPRAFHYYELIKYKTRRFTLLTILFSLPVLLAYLVFSEGNCI